MSPMSDPNHDPWNEHCGCDNCDPTAKNLRAEVASLRARLTEAEKRASSSLELARQAVNAGADVATKVAMERDAAIARAEKAEARVQELEPTLVGFQDECARAYSERDQAKAAHAKVSAAFAPTKAERDEARALADSLAAQLGVCREALADLAGRRACLGCLTGDDVPPYVRGKNTRLADDEHAPDCVDRLVRAALASLPSATSARDERLRAEAYSKAIGDSKEAMLLALVDLHLSPLVVGAEETMRDMAALVLKHVQAEARKEALEEAWQKADAMVRALEADPTLQAQADAVSVVRADLRVMLAKLVTQPTVKSNA